MSEPIVIDNNVSYVEIFNNDPEIILNALLFFITISIWVSRSSSYLDLFVWSTLSLYLRFLFQIVNSTSDGI